MDKLQKEKIRQASIQSDTVQLDFFDPIDSNFNNLPNKEDLRKKYPALQQAWDHYQTVLKMCKSKEDENNEN